MAKKRWQAETEIVLKKRDRLEVIVDTCCAGKGVFDDIDKLLDIISHERTNPSHVFDDYQLVIPIQIGTEIRRLVFPKIFMSEMRYTEQEHVNSPIIRFGKLEALIAKHSEGDDAIHDVAHKHVRAVENDVSRAFKLFYLKTANSLLQNGMRPELPNIAASANHLIKRYGFEDADSSPVTPEEVKGLCQQAASIFNTAMDRFYLLEGELRRAHEQQIYEDCSNVGISVDQLDRSQRRRYAESLEQKIEEQKIDCLAEEARFWFNDKKPEFTDRQRCIVQALYSSGHLMQKVRENQDFKGYADDSGERSIDEFLKDKRMNFDEMTGEKRVTLVVTKDKGALNSIERIRQEDPRHTIICLNPDGLKDALRMYATYQKTLLIPEEQQVTMVSKAGKKPSNPNAEENQTRWATRFAQVLARGDYAEHAKEIKKWRSGVEF